MYTAFFITNNNLKKREKMGVFEIIMLVLTAIVGTAGIAATAVTNKKNMENQQSMLEQQQDYATQAAAIANQETRSQYMDLYSPQSMLQQYEEAGLSPSLMYANGASVTGANTATQAHSTNLGAPLMNPAINNNFNQITDVLNTLRESQQKKSEAQKNEQYIENLKNEIDVNNTKIQEMLSNIEVNNSEINLNNVRTQLEACNAIGKQIENEVAAATKQDRIKIVSQGLENMKKEYEKLGAEVDLLNIDKETRGELNNAIINNYKAQTALYWEQKTKTYVDEWVSIADIYLKGSQIDKNYEESAKLRQDVKLMKSKQNEIEANIKYLQSLENKNDAETILIKKKTTTETIQQINYCMDIMTKWQKQLMNGVKFTKEIAPIP